MPLYMFGTLLITAFSIIIVTFFVIYKKRQVQHFLHQQHLKYEYEHSLLHTKIEVREQAFETVSQDIHDNIGQVLSLGCIQLANLKNSIPDAENVKKLDSILSLFKKSVKDLRLLSHSLNTDLIEHRALRKSVETEFERIEAFCDIKCSLVIAEEDEDLLSNDQRLIIFRIIQEALQNIMKHARASQISIIMNQDGKYIVAKITDNGVGFVQNDGVGQQSLGFINMTNRARLLQAQLDIRSKPGAGTELMLTIPLNS